MDEYVPSGRPPMPQQLRVAYEGMRIATWFAAPVMFAYWQSLAVGWASK